MPALWARDEKTNQKTVLRQVWFPGCHSSVGGGDSSQGCSDITLVWMVSQVEEHKLGLKFDKTLFEQKVGKPHLKTPWGCAPWDESYTGVYLIAGKHKRTPGKYHFGPRSTRGKSSRGIDTFEEFHESVQNRLNYCHGNEDELGKYLPPFFKPWPWSSFGYPVGKLPLPIAPLRGIEKTYQWS